MSRLLEVEYPDALYYIMEDEDERYAKVNM